MPKKRIPKKKKEPRIAARISKHLRFRIDRSNKATNMSDSDLLATALEEFFQNHPTTASKIEAVVKRHTKAAAQSASQQEAA